MALDFFSNYEFYTASLLLIYSNHIIDSLVKNLNVGLGCMHRICVQFSNDNERSRG